MNDAEIKAWYYEKRGEKLVQTLKKKGFGAEFVAGRAEAKDAVMALIPEGASVGLTGSQTMDQIGVKAELRESGKYELIDPYEPGIEMAENIGRRKKTLTADVVVSSTNAITDAGQLVNLDGMGNRVACMIFGPDKVILAVGMNKVESDMHKAWHRVRNVAAPMNNKRLAMPNPCTETGECQDCASKTRICNYFSVIERSMIPERIHIVLIGEDLGY